MYAVLVFYFCIGLATLSGVWDTIFLQKNISLSAEQLVSLGIWTGLPWSIKLLFGSTLDSLPLPRKTFLLLGQLLMVACALAWVDLASTRYLFTALGGEYETLLLVGFLSSLGTVVARLSADVLAMEMPASKEQLDRRQVQVRTALVAGSLAGAILSGPLATQYSMVVVFALAAVPAVLSLLTSLTMQAIPRPSGLEDGTRMLLGSMAYSVLISVLALSLSSDGAQMAIFVFSLVCISAVLAWRLRVSELTRGQITYLVVGLVAIFLFRTTPGTGPGLMWYYLEVRGFDKEFLGNLRVIESLAGLGLLGLLSIRGTVTSLRKTLIVLTVAITALQLPDILIYYDMIGSLNPRHLVMLDGAASSALGQLAMVPLGMLVVRSAPGESRAIFLALTSSLMNLALVAGDILTLVLNKAFVVTRTDFSHLGEILLASFSIGLVLSLLGILIISLQKEP